MPLISSICYSYNETENFWKKNEEIKLHNFQLQLQAPKFPHPHPHPAHDQAIQLLPNQNPELITA